MFKLHFRYRKASNDNVIFRLFRNEEEMYMFIHDNDILVVQITELE